MEWVFPSLLGSGDPHQLKLLGTAFLCVVIFLAVLCSSVSAPKAKWFSPEISTITSESSSARLNPHAFFNMNMYVCVPFLLLLCDKQ